ncbi:MAG TPA: OmpA family protein, partial [Chthoniobacterales bacterium]|nr:OmpA family protein [Chthoniobacterales bacterium]
TLETFFADPSAVDAARPLLESCLRSEYKPIETRRHTRPWLVLAIAAAVLIGGALSALPRYAHWRDFLRRLNSQPGIAVTSAEHNWLRRSRVAGLRDPLAADPAAIAREARLDPDRIHFEWKEYLAIDPVSVLRRLTHRIGHPPEANVTVENGIVQVSGRVPFEWLERLRREGPQVTGVRGVVERDITTTYDPTLALERFKAAFPLPETVTASVENETLVLAGSAPYEWIAPVREGAASIPGITGINGDNLIIDFDPALVFQRFQERFGLPETARASMQHGRLLLSGEAPHAWLRRVRHGALEVPGVRVLDDRNVEDIDQRTFQQAKGAVESTYVYFPPKQDNLTAEASAALSRLPDQIRRCFDAAQRMDVNVVLELRGYADALGREGGNVDLSRRRAEAVRNFLISAGLDGEKINSLGLGAPPPPEPGERPQPEQSSRRVAFRVAIQP